MIPNQKKTSNSPQVFPIISQLIMDIKIPNKPIRSQQCSITPKKSSTEQVSFHRLNLKMSSPEFVQTTSPWPCRPAAASQKFLGCLATKLNGWFPMQLITEWKGKKIKQNCSSKPPGMEGPAGNFRPEPSELFVNSKYGKSTRSLGFDHQIGWEFL